ncbi:GIY-YIG nuclease family protein [Bauldia litoralis]|uniref:GIY-YIG nuclease family protein n=1 Tax=Bauldia litoralis TaxID=665467 RepID=UPI003266C97D
MKQHSYFVYMLASRIGGTLYVGVTNDLERRVEEHRAKTVEGFTRRHGVDRLVWFEPHGDIRLAIAREKQLKKWNRAWKVRLIEKANPNWDDLFLALMAPYHNRPASPVIPGER